MGDIMFRILKLMKEKGMDQKTFAKAIGIRPQAITEWKNGTTSSYTKYIDRIAEVLDTTVNYLRYGDFELVTHCSEVPPQESLLKLFDEGKERAILSVQQLHDYVAESPDLIQKANDPSCYMTITLTIHDGLEGAAHKTINIANSELSEDEQLLLSFFRHMSSNNRKLLIQNITNITNGNLQDDNKTSTIQDDVLTEAEHSLALAYRAASEDDRAVVDAALRKYKPNTSEKKAM